MFIMYAKKSKMRENWYKIRRQFAFENTITVNKVTPSPHTHTHTHTHTHKRAYTSTLTHNFVAQLVTHRPVLQQSTSSVSLSLSLSLSLLAACTQPSVKSDKVCVF